MKLITSIFKSEGLHEKHVVTKLQSFEPSQHLLIDTGKPRENYVEVAGRRTLPCVISNNISVVHSPSEETEVITWFRSISIFFIQILQKSYSKRIVIQ